MKLLIIYLAFTAPLILVGLPSLASENTQLKLKPCFCSYDDKYPQELSFYKNNQFLQAEGLASWRCDPVNLYPLRLDSFRLADHGGSIQPKVIISATDNFAIIVDVGGSTQLMFDTARILQWGAGTQVSEYTSSQAVSTSMAVGTLLFGIPGMLAGGLIGSAPRYSVDESVSFPCENKDGSREVVTFKNDPSAPSSNYSRLSNPVASGSGLKAGVLIG